ncbi:MAG: hypothetical protein FWD65_04865 [Coriobacteriia bacterium]|nr:hypothetical protein [Coriobacteriia bacterium]
MKPIEEGFEIHTTDERNIAIMDKTCSATFKAALIIFALATVALAALGAKPLYLAIMIGAYLATLIIFAFNLHKYRSKM